MGKCDGHCFTFEEMSIHFPMCPDLTVWIHTFLIFWNLQLKFNPEETWIHSLIQSMVLVKSQLPAQMKGFFEFYPLKKKQIYV